ncbi:hypothetical protein BC835DRAFT_1265766 [Cytidiella melzeri]|nr:hypothetical protein BC835DRAFT_1265766 [Cytidiella melzeri]
MRDVLFVSSRPLAPESPQSFRSSQPKQTSLFPPDDECSYPALRLDGLVDFLSDYNRTHRYLLQIWTATAHPPGRVLPDPLVVRFLIPDVLTVYVTLGTAEPDSTIILESATVFGSREKKPPHAQSEYAVFQRLSQHLAKMLQSKPQASVQLVVQLLASYEDLFVRPCSACKRVISTEGHIPPVARTWLGGGDKNDWDARHPVCATLQ